jgi:hypothetical protein
LGVNCNLHPGVFEDELGQSIWNLFKGELLSSFVRELGPSVELCGVIIHSNSHADAEVKIPHKAGAGVKHFP